MSWDKRLLRTEKNMSNWRKTTKKKLERMLSVWVATEDGVHVCCRRSGSLWERHRSSEQPTLAVTQSGRLVSQKQRQIQPETVTVTQNLLISEADRDVSFSFRFSGIRSQTFTVAVENLTLWLMQTSVDSGLCCCTHVDPLVFISFKIGRASCRERV